MANPVKKQAPTSFPEDILARPEVKEALQKLGIDPHDHWLNCMLYVIFLLPTIKRSQPLVPGMTDRHVRKLPERLEALADQIEWIRRSRGFYSEPTMPERIEAREKGSPPHLLTAEARDRLRIKPQPMIIMAPEVRDSLPENCLPRLLRRYAGFLRYNICRVPRKGGPLTEPQKEIIWLFQERVRALSRRYHDEELAGFLQAVAYTERRLDLSEYFGGEQLKKLRQRMKKKHRPSPVELYALGVTRPAPQPFHPPIR